MDKLFIEQIRNVHRQKLQKLRAVINFPPVKSSIPPNCQIEILIDEISNELREYQSKPGAKSYIIGKREQLIVRLADIQEAINSLKMHEIWQLIESEIDFQLKLNSEVQGTQIILPYNRPFDIQKFSLIDLTKGIPKKNY